LGLNSESDYGLVHIDHPQNLTVAQLGDSAALRPGEWVIATGHPLGLHRDRPPVLRIGRVRLRGRRGASRRIMTDAPLISGDSGGPLYDLNGRVVGINSMIAGDRPRTISLH